MLWLAGCTVTEPEAPVEHHRQQHADVRALLEEARVAMADSRLTTPAESSAYHYYQRVLRLDPGNIAARDGISAIADRYLSWAIDYARDGNVKRARHFLGRAEYVDARHPSIEPVARLINDTEQVRRESFTLPGNTVVTRNSRDPLLDRIAGRIVTTRPFVTIQAPDDAAGRWIYQQLNNRVSFRVEAEFVSGNPSRIELTIRPDA